VNRAFISGGRLIRDLGTSGAFSPTAGCDDRTPSATSLHEKPPCLHVRYSLTPPRFADGRLLESAAPAEPVGAGPLVGKVVEGGTVLGVAVDEVTGADGLRVTVVVVGVIGAVVDGDVSVPGTDVGVEFGGPPPHPPPGRDVRPGDPNVVEVVVPGPVPLGGAGVRSGKSPDVVPSDGPCREPPNCPPLDTVDPPVGGSPGVGRVGVFSIPVWFEVEETVGIVESTTGTPAPALTFGISGRVAPT
jgi:hypothetical protein